MFTCICFLSDSFFTEKFVAATDTFEANFDNTVTFSAVTEQTLTSKYEERGGK